MPERPAAAGLIATRFHHTASALHRRGRLRCGAHRAQHRADARWATRSRSPRDGGGAVGWPRVVPWRSWWRGLGMVAWSRPWHHPPHCEKAAAARRRRFGGQWLLPPPIQCEGLYGPQKMLSGLAISSSSGFSIILRAAILRNSTIPSSFDSRLFRSTIILRACSSVSSHRYSLRCRSTSAGIASPFMKNLTYRKALLLPLGIGRTAQTALFAVSNFFLAKSPSKISK